MYELYKRCVINANEYAEFIINIDEGSNFTKGLEIRCYSRNCVVKNNQINIHGFKGEVIEIEGFLFKGNSSNSSVSIVNTSPNAADSHSLLRFRVKYLI